MEAYAVVKTGGKQYRVRPGDVLDIEKLPGEEGTTVELRPVLALSDGATLRIGTPILEEAKVTAAVVQQFRGPKLIAFKKKRRKGYSRTKGHRQSLTRIRIDSIQ